MNAFATNSPITDNVAFTPELSIFIPRVPMGLTHDQVHYAFEFVLDIGKIHRVDFAPVNPGTRSVSTLQESNNTQKSMFIHFVVLKSNNKITNDILKFIERKEPYKLFVNKFFNKIDCMNLFPNMAYMMVLKSTTYIPDTYMNIHQIADALKKQEAINQRLIQFLTKMCGENKELVSELGEIMNTPL